MPGIPLHVVQRGINRNTCFFSEADYSMYLHFLKKEQKPIDEPAAYQGLQARIAATLEDSEADYAAFYEEAKRRADHDSDPSAK